MAGVGSAPGLSGSMSRRLPATQGDLASCHLKDTLVTQSFPLHLPLTHGLFYLKGSKPRGLSSDYVFKPSPELYSLGLLSLGFAHVI